MIQDVFDPAIRAEYQQEVVSKSLLELPIKDLGSRLFDIDLPSVGMLLISFLLNVVVAWAIIHFFYYKRSHRKDYYFTFMLFSVTVFLLLYMLQGLSMNVGFALGLFAVFGMIRYRTESLHIRDMTYLFIIIGLSAVNGLSITVPFASILMANFLFLFFVFLLESNRFLHQNATKIVLYEKIDLIKPDKYKDLLANVKERTGLDVIKIEVGHIDFLRDVAFLKVHYKANSDEINTIDHVTKFS
ncbi:MAG: DUF4956 domain-containing protein [Dysgonamonadaceae bacterium]|jgi:hypothetical protein|nr:DUF4956 domain-containing protein [Dysgonamonadaceae bacterium]